MKDSTTGVVYYESIKRELKTSVVPFLGVVVYLGVYFCAHFFS